MKRSWWDVNRKCLYWISLPVWLSFRIVLGRKEAPLLPEENMILKSLFLHICKLRPCGLTLLYFLLCIHMVYAYTSRLVRKWKKKINIHLEKLQCVSNPFMTYLTTVHFISMKHLWVKSSMTLTIIFAVQPYWKCCYTKVALSIQKLTRYLLHE